MQNYHHPVAVGGIDLPGNLFFAPVAGYSDAAFRSVCVDEGADLCFTEMVSSEALIRNHAKTKALLVRAENEKAYAIQLFGSHPEVLAEAARLALAWKPLVVDLNCGCPVPKIVRSGCGSALLKEPERLGAIVAAMSQVLAPAGVPLTVKIRLGWDSSSINYRETANAAVEAGAAAVTLHARTRAQGYSGAADWAAIADLASRLPVPVFGSGDLFSADAARRFMEETGAAGLMIARGAMGNPFIFREAKAVLEGREAPPIGIEERVAAARRHLALSARYLGERTACVEFRKQFCSYTKGSVAGAGLRNEAVRASTSAQFEELFARWLEGAGNPGEGAA
jgi:nifR3 family TIM-barrel protein